MQLLVTTRASVWPWQWVAAGAEAKTGGQVVKGEEHGLGGAHAWAWKRVRMLTE